MWDEKLPEFRVEAEPVRVMIGSFPCTILWVP
jgi:hypothetical protein